MVDAIEIEVRVLVCNVGLWILLVRGIGGKQRQVLDMVGMEQ